MTTTIGSAPYLDVQTAHDLAFAWGSRSFIKSHNANDVRREALDELVELVATAPGEGTFSVTALGGAIGRVPEDATAYAGRAAAFDLSADSAWTDPALDDANVDWCRRAMAVVEPDRALGAYANGNADVGPEETRRIYGDAKLARLAALKRDLGPRQRVPREPQRGARADRSTPPRALNPPMHVRSVEGEERVTPLELFFDLVFVFALTQVTGSSPRTRVGRAPARRAPVRGPVVGVGGVRLADEHARPRGRRRSSGRVRHDGRDADRGPRDARRRSVRTPSSSGSRTSSFGRSTSSCTRSPAATTPTSGRS